MNLLNPSSPRFIFMESLEALRIGLHCFAEDQDIVNVVALPLYRDDNNQYLWTRTNIRLTHENIQYEFNETVRNYVNIGLKLPFKPFRRVIKTNRVVASVISIDGTECSYYNYVLAKKHNCIPLDKDIEDSIIKLKDKLEFFKQLGNFE